MLCTLENLAELCVELLTFDPLNRLPHKDRFVLSYTGLLRVKFVRLLLGLKKDTNCLAFTCSCKMIFFQTNSFILLDRHKWSLKNNILRGSESLKVRE